MVRNCERESQEVKEFWSGIANGGKGCGKGVVKEGCGVGIVERLWGGGCGVGVLG